MAHSDPHAIQCIDMSVLLAKKIVVKNASLPFLRGTWTSVVGPNGAGKTTLLKALAGLLPHSGDVQLFGQSTLTMPLRTRSQMMSWLGQNESSVDDMLALDVVMLGRLPHQSWWAGPQKSDHYAVQQAMHLTKVWDLRYHPMRKLSSGQRQRIMIARVLAVQAQVVLMDEPLIHLDPPHQADWLLMVKTLVAEGKTVLSVLHDISMALQADYLVAIKHGQVLCHGTCDNHLTQQALVDVFDGRLAIHYVAGQRVALPRIK